MRAAAAGQAEEGKTQTKRLIYDQPDSECAGQGEGEEGEASPSAALWLHLVAGTENFTAQAASLTRVFSRLSLSPGDLNLA